MAAVQVYILAIIQPAAGYIDSERVSTVMSGYVPIIAESTEAAEVMIVVVEVLMNRMNDMLIACISTEFDDCLVELESRLVGEPH